MTCDDLKTFFPKYLSIGYFQLKGLPLGNRGIFREIEIHHIQVPKNNNKITLDIRHYI